MSPTSYQAAPPRDKAGAEVYDRSIYGSIEHPPTRKPASAGSPVQLVPRRGLEPLHPMGTTTSRLRVYQFHHLGITTLFGDLKNIARILLLLLWSLRYVSWNNGWLLPFEHRHIICRRLLLHFQYRWIWQPYLSQLLSFLFSKVT